MNRVRSWFYRWLPAEVKTEYIAAYKKLEGENQKLQQENRELRAYIDGMHSAMRSRTRVQIVNERSK